MIFGSSLKKNIKLWLMILFLTKRMLHSGNKCCEFSAKTSNAVVITNILTTTIVVVLVDISQ